MMAKNVHEDRVQMQINNKTMYHQKMQFKKEIADFVINMERFPYDPIETKFLMDNSSRFFEK